MRYGAIYGIPPAGIPAYEYCGLLGMVTVLRKHFAATLLAPSGRTFKDHKNTEPEGGAYREPADGFPISTDR